MVMRATGNVIVDDEAGRQAGDLEPFIGRSEGACSMEKSSMPLSVLQQSAYEGKLLRTRLHEPQHRSHNASDGPSGWSYILTA